MFHIRPKRCFALGLVLSAVAVIAVGISVPSAPAMATISARAAGGIPAPRAVGGPALPAAAGPPSMVQRPSGETDITAVVNGRLMFFWNFQGNPTWNSEPVIL